jgi:hypothetical protein
MDFKTILFQLDQEIEKLKSIRKVLAGLASPVRPQSPAKRSRRKAAFKAIQAPEPRLIVLPPITKREYGRRLRSVPQMPKALAAPISTKPVFVPKTSLAAPRERVTNRSEMSPDALEAVLRRNLLGRVA